MTITTEAIERKVDEILACIPTHAKAPYVVITVDGDSYSLMYSGKRYSEKEDARGGLVRLVRAGCAGIQVISENKLTAIQAVEAAEQKLIEARETLVWVERVEEVGLKQETIEHAEQIMLERLNTQVSTAAAALGRRGGAATKGISTEAKKAAARANGAKGGRPRKAKED